MRILFLTGKLAAPSLQRVLSALSSQVGFEFEIGVLKISVAALMTAAWVGRQLREVTGFDRVLLPGWCDGPLEPLADQWGIPVERGPKDLHDLPAYFKAGGNRTLDLSRYSIEILAELNHAPRLSRDELLRRAHAARADGANLIDLGMIPGEIWTEVGEAVCALREAGHRVSIDSFQRDEVVPAVRAGAELVLSCNSTNVAWLSQLDVESVVVPDDFADLTTLTPVIEQLDRAGRRYRLDPILEPIGFGFARSLERYFRVRQLYPATPMMMGVGNLTELTEVDSAGVNLLLAAICEELRIQSVLTTEVINWARTSVREFDLARRLAHRSVSEQVLPKNVGGQLLLARDARLNDVGEEGLQQLASQIKDPNFRIFAERGELHLINGSGYWHGADPYEVFDAAAASADLSPSHAFYLGYELCKARTALTLGKQYRQDEALRWGYLTVEEISALHRRKDVGGPPAEDQSAKVDAE